MSNNSNTLLGGAAIALTATLWLGLLLGVSFLATPVKFAASTLTLPVALDVGRVTFALLSKVEWAMAVLTAGCVLLTRLRPVPALLFALLLSLLALQSFWLLPILDTRIAAVIAGTPLAPTSHHLTYVAVEIAKAVLLLSLAVFGLRRLVRPSPGKMPAGSESTRTGASNGISLEGNV